ncbi:hypothetical protein [Corynebacterium sp. MNWGS58]|uniref:hypothetical protein n=1 Tax=Corynebacterium sp. 102791.4 TaxID=3104612 RepID=UPI003514DCF7
MPQRSLRTAVTAVIAASGLVVSSCSSVQQNFESRPFEKTTSAVPTAVSQARSENLNRFVDDSYQDSVQVIAEDFGLQTVREFFPQSRTLIVVENRDGAIARGASIAIAQYAPVVIYDRSIRREIRALIDELHVERVLTVGNVAMAEAAGDVHVFNDPGTDQALADFTAQEFEQIEVTDPGNLVHALSQLTPGGVQEVVATWDPLETREHDKLPAVYAQSRRDKEMAPVMVATENSPAISVANATAFGAKVRMMPDPDPTKNFESLALVAGLADGPLIAFGRDFGTSREFSHNIRVAELSAQRAEDTAKSRT